MTKVFRKKKLFLFFFCFSVGLRAQDVLVPEAVNAAIRKKCPVCLLHSFGYYNPSHLRSPLDIAEICYHNCHTSLRAGNVVNAYRYAQLTTTALADSLHHPLYINSIFLLAKINQFTDSIPTAIKHFKTFATFKNNDPVLAGDAYASLTMIYLARGEWQQMDRYLTIWYKDYSFLSDSATRRNIYDSIVSSFSPSRNIPDPVLAIGIAERFFLNYGNSSRLTDLYYNVAAWYVSHSKIFNALIYLKKGLKLALANANQEEQQKFYLRLSEAEEKRGRFDAALRYRKLYEETVAQMITGAGPMDQDHGQKKNQIGQGLITQ
jgi:hypothetical protein